MKNNNEMIIIGVAVRSNKNGLYSLNDLHKASGGKPKDTPARWLSLKKTQDLIESVKKRIKNTETTSQKWDLLVDVNNGGNDQGVYAHELLLISYAGWINSDFQVEVNHVFLETMRKRNEELQKENTTLQENQNRVLRSLVANDALGLDMSGFHKKVADVIKRSFVLLGKGYTLSPIEFPLNRLNGDQKKMAIDYLLANGAERVPNCVYIRIKV